jgi:hypothetical protein
MGNTLIATAINTSNLGGHKITQVAAGYDHSLLIVAIPEPASLALAGAAALALLRLPRRLRWRLYSACTGE